MIKSRKLRHRIKIERPVFTQNQNTGDMVTSWEEFKTVWGSIQPLSARDLIASQAEESRVMAIIVIRYLAGINDSMRIYHSAKDKYYNIEGILTDIESGLEYITIPVSEGLKYQEGNI